MTRDLELEIDRQPSVSRLTQRANFGARSRIPGFQDVGGFARHVPYLTPRRSQKEEQDENNCKGGEESPHVLVALATMLRLLPASLHLADQPMVW